MEEEPIQVVPDILPKDDFVVSASERDAAQSFVEKSNNREDYVEEQKTEFDDDADKEPEQPTDDGQDGADEFDLSDISHSPVEADREDIIAKAEAAAFSDE